MRILIISNCQGRKIAAFLKKIFVYKKMKNIEIEYIKNYSSDEYIITNLKTISNKNFDVFIYQPLRSNVIINLIKDLKKVNKNLVEISFPYIFSDGLSCLSLAMKGKKVKKVHGEKYIIDLLDKKLSKIVIMKRFFKNKIDFKNQERFNNSLNEIIRREQTTTIKVSNFIKENYKTKKLFLTHNHPSTIFFEYLIKNILNILKIEYDNLLLNKIFKYKIINGQRVNVENNVSKLPIDNYVLSIYDKENNNISYFNKNWKSDGFKLIKIIMKRYKDSVYSKK